MPVIVPCHSQSEVEHDGNTKAAGHQTGGRGSNGFADGGLYQHTHTHTHKRLRAAAHHAWLPFDRQRGGEREIEVVSPCLLLPSSFDLILLGLHQPFCLSCQIIRSFLKVKSNIFKVQYIGKVTQPMFSNSNDSPTSTRTDLQTTNADPLFLLF